MKYLITITILFVSIAAQGQLDSFPKVVAFQTHKAVKRVFKESQVWYRKVKYIGVYKDTIHLSDHSDSLIENNDNTIPISLYRRFDNYSFECADCIDIKVDTSQILTLLEVEWKRNRLKDIYYKSYPVIIENKSDSLYKIGFGKNVRIILEALDADGMWKPIEIPYMYRCGTGLTDLYLQSHQITCVLIPVYYGEFRTQLRLRLNNHLSKPFSASISSKQFNPPKEVY